MIFMSKLHPLTKIAAASFIVAVCFSSVFILMEPDSTRGLLNVGSLYDPSVRNLTTIPTVFASDKYSLLPELDYIVIAQGESFNFEPYGDGVRFNTSLKQIFVSMDFKEDVFGRILESRLYYLGQRSEKPGRISVGPAWRSDTTHQRNVFNKPPNSDWPEGRYEIRTYVDQELLRVLYLELYKDAPDIPVIQK